MENLCLQVSLGFLRDFSRVVVDSFDIEKALFLLLLVLNFNDIFLFRVDFLLDYSSITSDYVYINL